MLLDTDCVILNLRLASLYNMQNVFIQFCTLQTTWICLCILDLDLQNNKHLGWCNLKSWFLKENSLFHHCLKPLEIKLNRVNLRQEVWRQPSARRRESDPAGWWIMTLSSANESGSALNPFSKSIKRANKSLLPAYPEITAGGGRLSVQHGKLLDMIWDKRAWGAPGRRGRVSVWVCGW